MTNDADDEMNDDDDEDAKNPNVMHSMNVSADRLSKTTLDF